MGTVSGTARNIQALQQLEMAKGDLVVRERVVLLGNLMTI